MGSRVVLGTTAAVTTACILPSFLLGAMAVQVRRDLGFGETGIGFAFAGFFAVAALGSAPLGRLAERRGPVWSLRAAAAVSAAATLTTAVVASSLATLLVPIAVAGAANALCQPAANLLIARAVPAHRQGIAFAVKQSAIPASTLLAGAAVPALALTVGWRWAFVGAALLAVTAGLAVPAHPVPVSHGGATGAVAASAPGGGGPDVPGRIMVLLALGVGFGAAAGGTLGSFLVSAAVDSGIGEAAAGWILTVGSLVGIGVRVTAGLAADRRSGGHLRVVARMLAGGAVAFALLSSEARLAYVLAGPAAFCTAWAWPGLFNLAVVLANPSRPAAATGLTQTGTYIGAVSGPLLFGVVAGATSYRVAWVLAALFSVGAAAAVTTGRRALRAWRATAAAVPA